MQDIYETNDEFDFSKLTLSSPVSTGNGNFFIRFLINNTHLYIQPPKCSTKQGILKSGKKLYTDLIFTNENENLIRWMENLETYCQTSIYSNRNKWFDGDMEIDDIENYFTSIMKVYKSGKYYSIRANIPTGLGKPLLKIYDENGNDVELDKITDKTNVMTILEISGIKCSTRSFQLEVELKQMMALKPNNLFEKVLLTTPKEMNSLEEPAIPDVSIQIKERNPEEFSNNIETQNEIHDEIPNESLDTNTVEIAPPENSVATEVVAPENTTMVLENGNDVSEKEDTEPDIIVDKNENNLEKNDIEEIDLSLDNFNLDIAEVVQIKQRDEIYYNMYRNARKKAKIARDFAISSYLEAKQIKNTYKLDDIGDSDESDLEQLQF